MRSLFPEIDPDEPPGPDRRAAEADAQEHVWTVSQLTAEIKDLLEGSFPAVWVAGEISNFSRPQSGHCYLTLKDERAQLRAVIWRPAAARVRFELHDGLQVACFGSLDVYAPRGSYQLVIEHLQPLGQGALELALRQLQARLAAEGLFDPARKRPLPRFPRRIAVVTSPTGAAIRDFLQVLGRRWRGVDVLIVPVRVQGDAAAAEIAAAIELVNRLPETIDCLVVTRGGGSLEDLWAFNDERVVRAIHASRIPVVSGVGHEIDVTLADLAADVRALTPSEAAERVVPAADELRRLLAQQHARLTGGLRGRAAAARARLEWLAARRSIRRPLERIREAQRGLDEWAEQAGRLIAHRLELTRHRADRLAGQLESLSPLAVLRRGYSLTWIVESQPGSLRRLVRDASQLEVGDRIHTRYDRGATLSRVETVIPDEQSSSPDHRRSAGEP